MGMPLTYLRRTTKYDCIRSVVRSGGQDHWTKFMLCHWFSVTETDAFGYIKLLVSDGILSATSDRIGRHAVVRQSR